ncbi:MAG: hemin-degrading factor [Deltaproteobacteria bacterium]|nr:hemin-degrading factor [Deltaproteobacteria bacterium]
MVTQMHEDAHALRTRWEDLKRESTGRLFTRDAAAKLGTTEAALLATRINDGVTKLEGDFSRIIAEMPKVGPVTCITRNDASVIEKTGTFEDVAFFGGNNAMGQVLGPIIDLRLFMTKWHTGYAVVDETPRGTKRSLQFFDKHGEAVFKIFWTDDADEKAFDEFTRLFRADDQTPVLDFSAPPAPKEEKILADDELTQFQSEWRELKDTHDFFGMLLRYGLRRIDAMIQAPEGFSVEIPVERVEALLQAAAQSEQPIMAFVASPGCVEIHTGPIKNVKRLDTWLNILDPGFNLHMRSDFFRRAWIVRKPTTDGVVTSIEVYDDKDEMTVQFFGARKPGIPEREDWRELVAAHSK